MGETVLVACVYLLYGALLAYVLVDLLGTIKEYKQYKQYKQDKKRKREK